MSARIDDVSEQEYRHLIEAVQETSLWCWDSDFVDAEVSDVARQAVETQGAAETRFRHSISEAVLSLRLPELGSPPQALKGLLEQPFDPRLNQKSRFAERLGEAHAVIADALHNRYISPVQSPYTVLSIDVPPQYSLQTLSEAAVLAGQVSLQVQSLHREIRQPVDTVVADDW